MNNPNPSRHSGAAFTLIEILAVLAVISAIIAIGVPAISRVLQSGRIRNAEGTASVVKSAVTEYLSKPGSPGTLPLTEGTGTAIAAEYTGAGSPTASAVAAAATLDNVLLAEGVLDRSVSLAWAPRTPRSPAAQTDSLGAIDPVIPGTAAAHPHLLRREPRRMRRQRWNQQSRRHRPDGGNAACASTCPETRPWFPAAPASPT